MKLKDEEFEGDEEIDEEIEELNGNASIDKVADVVIQKQIMVELANVTLLDTYSDMDIAGGSI